MKSSDAIDLEKYIANPELIFDQWIVDKIIIAGAKDDDPPTTYENVLAFVNEMGLFSAIIDDEGRLHQIPNERILEVIRPSSFVPFWKRTQLAGIVDQINQILTIERTYESENSHMGMG